MPHSRGAAAEPYEESAERQYPTRLRALLHDFGLPARDAERHDPDLPARAIQRGPGRLPPLHDPGLRQGGTHEARPGECGHSPPARAARTRPRLGCMATPRLRGAYGGPGRRRHQSPGCLGRWHRKEQREISGQKILHNEDRGCRDEYHYDQTSSRGTPPHQPPPPPGISSGHFMDPLQQQPPQTFWPAVQRAANQQQPALQPTPQAQYPHGRSGSKSHQQLTPHCHQPPNITSQQGGGNGLCTNRDTQHLMSQNMTHGTSPTTRGDSKPQRQARQGDRRTTQGNRGSGGELPHLPSTKATPTHATAAAAGSRTPRRAQLQQGPRL